MIMNIEFNYSSNGSDSYRCRLTPSAANRFCRYYSRAFPQLKLRFLYIKYHAAYNMSIIKRLNTIHTKILNYITLHTD